MLWSYDVSSCIIITCRHINSLIDVIIPTEQQSCWGVYWFHSVRPSVWPSVRLSRLPCPLCNIYSSGWILSILAANDHYHERVCRTQWSLTLIYIYKVIRPWLRKSCPLCSVYSSGFFLYLTQMITIITGCVTCYGFFRNLKIWMFEFLKFFSLDLKKTSTVLDEFFPY